MHCGWEGKTARPLWASMAVSWESRHALTMWPSSRAPGHLPQKNENLRAHNNLSMNVHCSCMCNSPKLETTRMSLNLLNKLANPFHRTLLIVKTEQTADTGNTLGGHQENYAKWKQAKPIPFIQRSRETKLYEEQINACKGLGKWGGREVAAWGIFRLEMFFISTMVVMWICSDTITWK